MQPWYKAQMIREIKEIGNRYREREAMKEIIIKDIDRNVKAITAMVPALGLHRQDVTQEELEGIERGTMFVLEEMCKVFNLIIRPG